VQSFLGLPQADLSAAEGLNTSFREGEPRAVRGTDVLWMNLVAGRAMRGSGYEPRRQKAGILTTAVSVVTAPLSLAATAVRIPSMVSGPFIGYLRRWRQRW
jgi:hypothetical protein